MTARRRAIVTALAACPSCGADAVITETRTCARCGVGLPDGSMDRRYRPTQSERGPQDTPPGRKPFGDALRCNDPLCDVCVLFERAGESHDEMVARIKAMLRGPSVEVEIA